MKKHNEVIYVYGQSLYDHSWHYGILGCTLNNGMQMFRYLYFNHVINRLDWLYDETVNFKIIKKVSNKQMALMFDYES